MNGTRAKAWATTLGLACGMMLLVSVAFTGTGRADEAMGYIPAEVEVVGSVHVSTLYTHAQMAFLREMIEGDLDGEAEKMKAMKIFPDNVQRLVFGVKPVVESKDFQFVVVLEMKEDIDTAGFAAFLTEDGQADTIAGQTVYVSPDESAVAAILSPKRVLFMSPEFAEAALSRANPVTGNAKLMAAANVPARKETLWAAFLPTKEVLAEMGGDMPPFVMDLEGVLLTIHLSDKLDLQAVGTFSNGESAAAMMGLMQMAVPMVMMFGSEIDAEIIPQVNVDGNAAKIAISTTPDTIEKIGNYIMSMMFGGMMMMEPTIMYMEDDEEGDW